MKNIFLLCILSLILQVVSAQPDDKKIGKITFLLVDGKYEDAAYKSTKLKEDPAYRKNAWVYYYMAQSYYEISKDYELEEKYPKALKEAFKAASKLYKYRNKPEENLDVYQDAQEFLTKLEDTAITIAQIYADNDNYRKATYYMARVVKFRADDYSAWLMKGIYEIKSRNIGEGVKSILFAMDSIKQEGFVPHEVSTQTLVDALEEYALIIKSGEYDQYFKAYKFEPTDKDVQEAMTMQEEFKKLLKGEVVDKEERKKESETIYKTFRSEEAEEDDDDE